MGNVHKLIMLLIKHMPLRRPSAFVCQSSPILRWMTGCSWNGITGKKWSTYSSVGISPIFGRGDFNQTGLTLLTMRNAARWGRQHIKTYAENVADQQDQQTPRHFRTHKMGRYPQSGRWRLMHAVGLGRKQAANLCDDQRVITVSVDGQRRTMKPGETLVLKPGREHLPAAASVSSLLGGKSVCSRLGNFDGK